MTISAPIVNETDVLVVGGTTGAVEAALAAREQGARVFLVSPLTYLGEDICACARYVLPPDTPAQTPLAAALFADVIGGVIPSPMTVKYGLEHAMIEGGIDFLYMTSPICLLRDENDQVGGLVVANRSGFQALRARIIIDATGRALVGRMTSATFAPFSAGRAIAERTVVGPAHAPLDTPAATTWPDHIDINEQACTGVTYRVDVDLPDASPGAFAAAEVQARLATWQPQQAFASDRVYLAAHDRLSGNHHAADWDGVEHLDLGCMRCGEDPVYILGDLADIGEPVIGALASPLNLMAAGRRLGIALADEVRAMAPAGQLIPAYPAASPVSGCDVQRNDRYFRFEGAQGVTLDLNRFPEIADVDVLVCGGGTGGAPAGISAARAGAGTLVLECLPCLGGVGTEGRISRYWYGNRVGFTQEVDRGVHGMGPDPEFDWDQGAWNTEWKKAWWLKAAAEAGTEVWFGSFAVAAAMDGRRVAGALVSTPQGLGLVRCKSAIDATGNADLAAAAGAEVVTLSNAHVAVQGAGLPPITPGEHYQNTDHTFVDDTDVMDVTRAFTFAREKFKSYFDLAQIVDTRERRQVRGEVSMDPLDFLAGRTFPDTVITAMSNFDTHGFTIHPVFMAKPPDEEKIWAHVPFRALLPRGLQGVAVTGLGVSAHRDALPVIRMQPDVQNQGYAVGLAAAMAADQGTDLREIDMATLQTHLVEKGILAPDVPGHRDSFPLPREEIAEAVTQGINDYLGLSVIFAHVDQSRPLLRDAYAAAGDVSRKLRYAHVLGLMGDDTGVDTLAEALDGREWDEGWDYTGGGQFGYSMSEVDSMLVALGMTRHPRARPTLLRKAEALPPDEMFSHFRALTLAFEAMPTPAAVPHFVRFLDHIGRHARETVAAAVDGVPPAGSDTSQRNAELRELLVARGLYACGDHEGRAESILLAYSRDLHGHYARHAKAILEADALREKQAGRRKGT